MFGKKIFSQILFRTSELSNKCWYCFLSATVDKKIKALVVNCNEIIPIQVESYACLRTFLKQFIENYLECVLEVLTISYFLCGPKDVNRFHTASINLGTQEENSSSYLLTYITKFSQTWERISSRIPASSSSLTRIIKRK